MEQIQDYLSSSCTLGYQALTVGGINTVKVHINGYIYIYIFGGDLCSWRRVCELCTGVFWERILKEALFIEIHVGAAFQ